MGDLQTDGKIKSHETETIFCSPSAWAIHCKRIINPDKRSGCGWASVKYRGKKLDTIKATYLRKKQLQRENMHSDGKQAWHIRTINFSHNVGQYFYFYSSSDNYEYLFLQVPTSI